MISRPQDDFKHTGHVGIDGASFGDISFLSNPNSTQNVSPTTYILYAEYAMHTAAIFHKHKTLSNCSSIITFPDKS